MKWFRFYTETLNDPKVLELSDRQFRFWVKCLCVASEHDGRLPDGSHHLARMRVDHFLSMRDALVKGGLIDALGDGYAIHNWGARQWATDTNRERQRRYRERHRNVTVTPPDTDTDNRYRVTDTEKTPTLPFPTSSSQEFSDEYWDGVLFKAYESAIGLLDAAAAERVSEASRDYGDECVLHSLEAMASNGKRSWKYAVAIMRRHQVEGCNVA